MDHPGLFAGNQGRIEETMEAGPPLKQTTRPPEPEAENGQRVHHSSHPPLWAQRLLLVIEVTIAVWAGILVILLPWTRLWTENPILASWPHLKVFFSHGFVRGMISGIGLVDVWMGISDATHFRDLR